MGEAAKRSKLQCLANTSASLARSRYVQSLIVTKAKPDPILHASMRARLRVLRKDGCCYRRSIICWRSPQEIRLPKLQVLDVLFNCLTGLHMVHERGLRSLCC